MDLGERQGLTVLTFDAERHEYRVDGVLLPSVTQVLKPLQDFSMIAPAVLEHARQRGIAVHIAVQLDICNDLVEESVAPELAGYLQAWRAFRHDSGIHEADFGDPEKPLYHPLYGFAGTPDVPFFFKKRWAVLDVKTADALSPVWGLQTAAYLELINANTPKGHHKVVDRYSLRLRENGTYRLEQHTDKNDWQVFLSCLTIHQWKGKNL